MKCDVIHDKPAWELVLVLVFGHRATNISQIGEEWKFFKRVPMWDPSSDVAGAAGEPKAIPWTHVTPMRCGVDAWAQQDVRRGDVVAWPTNLGWMMGPWLLYAALLNGAAVALFQARTLSRCKPLDWKSSLPLLLSKCLS